MTAGSFGKYGTICTEDLILEIYTVGKHFKEANYFSWPFKVEWRKRPWILWKAEILAIGNTKSIGLLERWTEVSTIIIFGIWPVNEQWLLSHWNIKQKTKNNPSQKKTGYVINQRENGTSTHPILHICYLREVWGDYLLSIHLFLHLLYKGRHRDWYRVRGERAEHQYGSQPHYLLLKWEEQGAASDFLSTEIWSRILTDEEENGWTTQVACSYWQPLSPIQWTLSCLGQLSSQFCATVQ